MHNLKKQKSVAGLLIIAIIITIVIAITTFSLSIQNKTRASNLAGAKKGTRLVDNPSLSFSYDTNTITFTDLDSANSWIDTKKSIFNVSTNAKSGYTIQAYITQLLALSAYPLEMVDDFYGRWENPRPWPSGITGFGYTSSDTLVQGSNRFAGGTKYAAFSRISSSEIVADYPEAVEGAQFNITYKIAVPENQVDSNFQTYVIYIATPNY